MKYNAPRSNLKTKKRPKMNKYPRYFTLQELLTSSVARQKSIENLPSWEIVEHLLELGAFLDELREAWGSGIKVTSGYRNEALNKAVGGVKTSVHQIGYAADLQPSNGKFKEFTEFVAKWLKNRNYDQAIIEEKGKTKWLHISLYNNEHKQRRQTFTITK